MLTLVAYSLKPVKLLGPYERTQHYWPTTRNSVVTCCVRLHGPKSLTGFKLCATSVNIVVVPCKRMQHVGPNNVACCWPTMLRSFAWALSNAAFEPVLKKKRYGGLF